MLTLFLVVLTLVLAGLALHPFTTYPLSLRLMRAPALPARPAQRLDPPAPQPRFALCVCAYNEEAVIERKVANMLEMRRRMGTLDILIYVDAASDRTAELLAPFADTVTLLISPERRGKTEGMNRLVALTRAEIVAFTDANVQLAPDALLALGRRFEDPSIGCVCSHLMYMNEDGTPTSAVGSLYWRLEEAIKEGESRLGAAMGADGSLFAVRRALHRPTPPELIDDMHLSLSILLDGYGIVRAGDALAYEESVTHSGEEFRRKVRIACQAFNVHRRLWPRLRRLPPLRLYMYLSHKLLRWLSIYSLALAALSLLAVLTLIGVPPVLVLLLPVAGLALFWSACRWRLPLLSPISQILLALAATGIGVAQSFRGRTFQTWTSAASIRVKRSS